MASEHPNAQAFRAAWNALQDGDVDGFRLTLHEDVIWHQAGPEAPLRGADDVVAALKGDLGSVEVEGDVHDVLANDDHVVALVQVTARRGGEEVSYRAVEIGHMRDGQLTERWTMVDDFQAVADFWGG